MKFQKDVVATQSGGGPLSQPSTSFEAFGGGAGSSEVKLINTIADVVTKRLLSGREGTHFAPINPNWKNYERAEPTVVSDGTVNTNPPLRFNVPIFQNDLNDSFDEHVLLKKVPKQFKKNAATLLKTFDEQPNEVTWDSSGNIYIEEQVIPNANIFDLFPRLFKKKVSKAAIGLLDLLQKLESMGLSHLIMCQTKTLIPLSNPTSSSTSSTTNWWYLGA